MGAFIPLIPFLLGFSGIPAISAAVVLVGLILLMIGGTIGILSGKPPFLRALRQAAIGIGAAVVTYLLGLAAGELFHCNPVRYPTYQRPGAPLNKRAMKDLTRESAADFGGKFPLVSGTMLTC